MNTRQNKGNEEVARKGHQSQTVSMKNSTVAPSNWELARSAYLEPATTMATESIPHIGYCEAQPFQKLGCFWARFIFCWISCGKMIFQNRVVHIFNLPSAAPPEGVKEQSSDAHVSREIINCIQVILYSGSHLGFCNGSLWSMTVNPPTILLKYELKPQTILWKQTRTN